MSSHSLKKNSTLSAQHCAVMHGAKPTTRNESVESAAREAKGSPSTLSIGTPAIRQNRKWESFFVLCEVLLLDALASRSSLRERANVDDKRPE